MSVRAEKQGARAAVWCPACDEPHGPQVEPVGAPGSWTWNGSLERPTFAPSLLVRWEGIDPPLTGKPVKRICHSFVRDGRIEFLGDCTHALAGKTVDLPDWP